MTIITPDRAMASQTTKIKNTLSSASSPYLLQHKDNPVHWQMWNSETLAQAKNLNRPILLSIGYSACHWCHVMAHESFEDNKTAETMNDLFINIKVDKEERPDLDKIYQNAHSMLTERPGGWPLTVFLTPGDHLPIFAGTYFPVEARHGLPSFRSLLLHINDIWQTRQTDIAQQSRSLQTTYTHMYESSKPADAHFDHTVIDIARNQIEKQFDSKNGGFSGAPKFPHPSILEFSIKHWSRARRHHQADPQILHCAIYSLEKMADGGLFDHLGGGFYRYSTDEQWMIPHFEKMLYDNGPLLSLYSQAWKLHAGLLFFDAARQTADWVIREMQHPDGGYYSAQDADSEGHEGKFFAWKKDEIETLLKAANDKSMIDAGSIKIFKQRFGLNRDENFDDSWHLHGYLSETSLADKNNIEKQQLHQQLQLIRQFLFQQREQRVHPATDTKILCAWNGLMIHGMASAGRLLDRPDYTESAIRAAYYLKNHCWQEDALSASIKDGKATLNAYVDDYAFLIYGLLELLQSQWDNDLYRWTQQLADQLLTNFEDKNYGGFYFTSNQHEKLIQRLKAFSDDAIPSGNAIAALSLNRLGYLSGKQHYIDAAERCLQSAWTAMNHAPVSHCALLNTLAEFMVPPNILIIRERTELATKDNWQKLAQQYYLPDTLVYTISADQVPDGVLSEKIPATDNHIAYPCNGLQCQTALESSAELQAYLQNNSYRVLE